MNLIDYSNCPSLALMQETCGLHCLLHSDTDINHTLPQIVHTLHFV